MFNLLSALFFILAILSFNQESYAGNDMSAEGGYQELPQFGYEPPREYGDSSYNELGGDSGFNDYGPDNGIRQPLPEQIGPAPGYGEEAPAYGSPGPDYGSDHAPIAKKPKEPKKPKKLKRIKAANDSISAPVQRSATAVVAE